MSRSSYINGASKVQSNARTPWLVFVLVLMAFAVFNFDPFYAFKYSYRDELIENVGLIASSIATADDPRRRVGLLALGVIGAWLLVFNRSRLRFNNTLAVLLSLFVLWACISWAWSDDSGLTMRRLSVLILLMVAASGIAARCSLKDIAWFGFASGVSILLAGLISELMLGSFRPFSLGYRFAGVLNPIGTAETSSIIILSVIPLAQSLPKSRLFLIAISVVVFVIMLMTRSRGPLLSLLLGVAIYLALTWPIRLTLFFGAACLFLVSVFVMISGDEIKEFVLLGRTQDVTTLTGRLPLWEIILKYINERPILGYGYNSFWTPGRFEEIAKYANFNVADVHNSYLGILLSLGYPAGTLLCVVLLGAIVRSARIYNTTKDPFYSFSCALLVYYVSDAVLLSVFFVEDFPSFVPLVILVHLLLRPPRAGRPPIRKSLHRHLFGVRTVAGSAFSTMLVCSATAMVGTSLNGRGNRSTSS